MNSERCIEGKFWNRSSYKCEPCETKYEIIKGYEFIENCGWSDEQHQIESPYKPCIDGKTFNDGSQVKCQNCRSCPTPQFTASECSTRSDAICCRQGEQAFNGKCIPEPLQTTRITTASTTVFISSSVASSSPSPSTQNVFPEPSTSTQSFMPTTTPSSTETSSVNQFIGIYVCFGILSTLILVCLFLFIKRRTKPFNEELKKCCNGASHESLSKKGIGRYEQAISYNIIKESSNNDHVTGLSHLLAPEVQDAPLKTVLNNLDVLEELVLVLDPDISGAKNTRHLAAQCSFSFAWINYAYSMKDHKSPLVAVLEGVVTKNPDWTVSHLAELLTAIGRNDAVEILAKLPAGV
ncbi:IGF-like family receptor 1 [Sinocyclocheilus grahami]|uniref:IGF-like family receptor 1 n=1 Tax=Sinocyclocheilus grahami TaxID=75366 RepID=UPI0007AD3969|nr:PREDICTED: IGF-like family receptor 1 [Sinocyclocheilus grahami]